MSNPLFDSSLGGDQDRLQLLLARQQEIQAEIAKLLPSEPHQHHRTPIHKQQSQRRHVPRSMSSSGAITTMARTPSVGQFSCPMPDLALMLLRIGSRCQLNVNEPTPSSPHLRLPWPAPTREARPRNEAATSLSPKTARHLRSSTPSLVRITTQC